MKGAVAFRQYSEARTERLLLYLGELRTVCKSSRKNIGTLSLGTAEEGGQRWTVRTRCQYWSVNQQSEEGAGIQLSKLKRLQLQN